MEEGVQAEDWQSTYGRGADSCIGFGEHRLPFVFFSWTSSGVSDHAQTFNSIRYCISNHKQKVPKQCVYISSGGMVIKGHPV